MLLRPNKKTATIIVASRKPKKEKDPSDFIEKLDPLMHDMEEEISGDEEEFSGKEAAAMDLAEAFKSNKAKMIVEALDAYLDLCKYEDKDDSDDSHNEDEDYIDKGE